MTEAPTAHGRPVSEGLFTWPSDAPQLIGSRCDDCGAVVFPAQEGCPRCTGEHTSPHLLARRGTLWSWTVQAFEPKSPYRRPPSGSFEPYGVGYVELAGEVKVESRLTVADPEALRIGMPMVMVLVPFAADDDGTPVLTFEFRPEPEG